MQKRYSVHIPKGTGLNTSFDGLSFSFLGKPEEVARITSDDELTCERAKGILAKLVNLPEHVWTEKLYNALEEIIGFAVEEDRAGIHGPVLGFIMEEKADE